MANYINNQWQKASGEKFNSINPASGQEIWSGNTSSPDEVDQAVQAARNAFTGWASLDLDKRKEYLENFVNLLKEKRDELASILCQDTGKALWECKMEIGGMINKLTISIQAYEERCPEKKSPLGKSDDNFSIVRHKPHGVVAVFGPYNFPGHVPNGHILPALLAGNTVVLKPSELTPYISEEIIKIWHEANLPVGVINLVQGKAETGIALSNHPDINGLFFTGSSKTGKILHKNFAGNPNKILALELGGNNPLVVHKAKDLKAAAYLTIQSAFISAGQRCTCARRLFTIDNQAFLDELISMTKSIKIGPPDADDIFMGPVISAAQADRLIEAQESLIKKGGKVLVEMKKLDLGDAYVSPGIIDCTDIKEGLDEEFFGPLLQVYRVNSFEKAIAAANNTNYGLSAGLISDSEKLYREFFYKINSGLINWNNQLTGAASSSPFGGIGDSGNHRPSAYYAADYCAYPVASLETSKLTMPEKISPGLLVAHDG